MGYRYTKKARNSIGYKQNSNDSLDDCLQKLGQLEDIEEELGIDLITLSKAHKNGIYVKNCSHKINSVDVCFKDRCRPTMFLECVVDGRDEWFYFEDYGKTWALTREELE